MTGWTIYQSDKRCLSPSKHTRGLCFPPSVSNDVVPHSSSALEAKYIWDPSRKMSWGEGRTGAEFWRKGRIWYGKEESWKFLTEGTIWIEMWKWRGLRESKQYIFFGVAVLKLLSHGILQTSELNWMEIFKGNCNSISPNSEVKKCLASK